MNVRAAILLGIAIAGLSGATAAPAHATKPGIGN